MLLKVIQHISLLQVLNSFNVYSYKISDIKSYKNNLLHFNRF